jgi:hypothetical protein
MRRSVLIAAIIVTAMPAAAQDVPGMEICTRESRMERRTSCLQSNVEYLQTVITKNALDAQQRLAAAAREIAALKAVVTSLQARVEQLEKARPEAKPDAARAEPKPEPGKPEAK